MCKFRKLLPNEIDVRIGQAISTSKWQGVSLLLYKNARVDMDILDETVGAENWQRKHEVINDNLYCSVGIWDDKKQAWVWKSDCGTESNTEKEKGEASDAFKRACVNWGIGRELYTAPKDMLITCELDEKKKPKDKKLKFFVSNIDYENGRISSLTIVNQSGEVLYQYPKKGNPNKTTQIESGKPSKTDEGKKDNKFLTRKEMIEIWGVSDVEATIKFYSEQLGVAYEDWDEIDAEAVREVLKNQKAKREAAKRKATLERIDDSDLPFPAMGDE
jgi:hypothetical protein